MMVLITGASSGIGAAFARELASRSSDLVLVARRRQRLERLADELHEQFGVNVEVSVADLTDVIDGGRVERRLAELDLESGAAIAYVKKPEIRKSKGQVGSSGQIPARKSEY